MRIARSLTIAAALVAGAASAALALDSDMVQKGTLNGGVQQIAFAQWLAAQTQRNQYLIYIGSSGYAASLDCLGFQAQGLGLSYGYSSSGEVRVRAFPDGSGEVQVDVDFKNALIWAAVYSTGVPVFGYSPPELAGGPLLAPGLASGHVQLKYIAPDAAQPEWDMMNAIFVGPGPVVSLKMHTVGKGPLRAGFGVTKATSGMCTIDENDFNRGGVGVVSVEHVDVKATGKAKLDGTGSATGDDAGMVVQSVRTSTWGRVKALYH